MSFCECFNVKLHEKTYLSKFEPLEVIWQSLQKAIPEDNKRFRGQKSMAKLFGQRSSTAWAGLTGEHTDKYSAVPSLLQLLLAATSSLQEDVLPLLQYWLSSRVKKDLMLRKFRAGDQPWQDELRFFDLKIFLAICLFKQSSTVLLTSLP